MSAVTRHQCLKLISNIAEKIFKAVVILTVGISLCVPLGPMEGFISSPDFITRQPGTEKNTPTEQHIGVLKDVFVPRDSLEYGIAWEEDSHGVSLCQVLEYKGPSRLPRKSVREHLLDMESQREALTKDKAR